MGPNESQRLALMHRLVDVLGEQEAATLMDSLPPYDWPEVATKSDVARAVETLRSEVALMLARQTRTLVLVVVGFAVSLWLGLLVPALA